MRCALFLAAWASALAVAQPALDPWLQALYGRRRPLKKDDVRAGLLQAADDDDAAGGGAPYDYGVDYAPPSSLLRRFFPRAHLEDDEDERTTLYCITVKPRTTPSTTPEVICFPPSRRPKKTRPTTPVGNCEEAPRDATTAARPEQAAKQRTTGRKHHSSSKTSRRQSTPRPSSARTRARKTHATTSRTTLRTSHRPSHTTRSAHRTPTVGECAVDVFLTAATSTPSRATRKTTARPTTRTTRIKTSKSKVTHKLKTTRRRTTARVTSRKTRVSTSRRTKSKKQEAKWCPVGEEPATTTRTRPPVDEFLAAWGYFRHHNSLDPRNGSHWREFHDDAGGARTPRRRHLSEPAGLLVLVPPWRQPPGLPDQRLSKRDGKPVSAAPPYPRLLWLSRWPPAGSEVSRLPVRDKDNFVKLASWWQDVMRTYNGHQRKKRAAQPRP